MRLALTLAGCLLSGAALAQNVPPIPQYPYPAEPQYQYPAMDSRGERLKCPKGQKPYQGVCRKWRRVD
jgi:hypothetical protein